MSHYTSLERPGNCICKNVLNSYVGCLPAMSSRQCGEYRPIRCDRFEGASRATACGLFSLFADDAVPSNTLNAWQLQWNA